MEAVHGNFQGPFDFDDAAKLGISRGIIELLNRSSLEPPSPPKLLELPPPLSPLPLPPSNPGQPEQTTPSSIIDQTLSEIEIKIETKPIRPEAKRTSTKRLPSSTQGTSAAKKRAHCYNLRETLKTEAKTRTSKNSDVAVCRFTPFNPCEYHSFKSDHANELIRVSNITRPEQVDCYEEEKCEYVMLSWLTTVRIFLFDAKMKDYNEFRRIPNRYMDITENIITCLHYCDGKFFIAYLWDADDRRPYMEIRDTVGKLLAKPLRFEEGNAVSSIYSDRDYIYIKTANGSLNIHRKEFLGVIHYSIDFCNVIRNSVLNTWVDQPTFDSYTRMPLVSATRREILVTLYDVLDHRVMHCYKFNDHYDIISMDKVDCLYVIHRRLEGKAMVDFGYLGRTPVSTDDLNTVFIHESRIKFSETSNIMQMKIVREHLYVFGSTRPAAGGVIYQIGCIFVPSLLPLWVCNLSEAGDDSLIVPHSSGICLINSCQRISHIPMLSHDIAERHRCKTCGFGFSTRGALTEHQRSLQHRSILSDLEITTNKFLNDRGSSIFKKLPLYESDD